MTPEEAVVRGTRAKQLLEDPLIVEAFNLIEKEIIEKWEACPARDKEAREELWVYYKTARKFRGILQGAIDNMQVAIFEQKSLKERALNMVRNLK